MTEQLKKAKEKVKENVMVKRAIAPKNSFWNKARWIGVGVTGVAGILEYVPGVPEWIKGIAGVVKWMGLTLFGTAQMTTK